MQRCRLHTILFNGGESKVAAINFHKQSSLNFPNIIGVDEIMRARIVEND